MARPPAILTAKIIDINRFPTDNDLVGCFGCFPEENRSGVDKQGKPLPPGPMCMSQKGNDLACPIHGQPTDKERTFSVNLGKNLFQCFHKDFSWGGGFRVRATRNQLSELDQNRSVSTADEP